jgi:hypothetical protein
MFCRHNHSPGFEVLPNGDVLAVWFSSSVGVSGGEPGIEGSINSRMVQARLRHVSPRVSRRQMHAGTMKLQRESLYA